MRHGLTLHKPTSALSARESIRRTNKRRILCLGGINAVAMRGPVQDTDTLSTPNQKSSQGAEGRPPPLPLLSLQARPTVSHRRMASGRLLVGVAQWPGTNSSFRRELRNPEKIGEAQDIPVGSSGSPPGQALLQQIYVVSVSTTSCQHLDLNHGRRVWSFSLVAGKHNSQYSLSLGPYPHLLCLRSWLGDHVGPPIRFAPTFRGFAVLPEQAKPKAVTA